MLLKYALSTVEIVVRHVQRQRSQRRRHTRAFGYAECSEPRSRLRQKTVRVPVITAFEFHDEVALSRSARQPHRAHRRFRAARNETDFFNARNRPRNQRRKFQLQLGRHPKTCAATRLVGYRLADGGIRVSQDHRAPGAHVVEQFVPVRVVEMLTAAALDNQRVPTYGTECPHGTVHTAH